MNNTNSYILEEVIVPESTPTFNNDNLSNNIPSKEPTSYFLNSGTEILECIEVAGTPDKEIDRTTLQQSNVHLLSQYDPFPTHEVE